MRRTFGLTLAVAAFAANAFAGIEARLTGTVTDAVTNAPIAGATVLVESAKGAGRWFKQEFKTDKDGKYAIFLLDGTMRYVFSFSAANHAPYQETMKLTIGQPNLKDVKLGSQVAAGPAVGTIRTEADPSITAYNEGAALANEGKVTEAIAKMEAAVAAKPDLVTGYQSLARLYLREKDYAKSIDRATKALEYDAEDSDMNAVLFEAYTAKGDKAKANEYKAKMPANPGLLFNDAARAINAGNDKEAEDLLKKAVVADEKFSAAYYELGMLYVRAGKNADAKRNLEKYLEITPDAKDASTAKEMLKYVK